MNESPSGQLIFDVFGLQLFKANALTTSSQTIFEDKNGKGFKKCETEFFQRVW
jgi:hypothetical protein